MTKTWKTWKLLALALLLALGLASAVTAAPAPALVKAPALCSEGNLSSADVQEPAQSDLFAPEPVDQSRPICLVTCVDEPCQKNSDCTARPGGSCQLACPKNGCCVYP
jgi:hypothetical protein